MTCQSINTRGYSDNIAGFSGAFSWFRSAEKPGLWHVMGYVPGFSSDGYAVTDDFGNLVRVEA